MSGDERLLLGCFTEQEQSKLFLWLGKCLCLCSSEISVNLFCQLSFGIITVSVGGILVRIAASQAVELGTIPGQCIVVLWQMSAHERLILGYFSGQEQSKLCLWEVRSCLLWSSETPVNLFCQLSFVLFTVSVGGIVVRIAASQAVDPGSIPGQCIGMLFRMPQGFRTLEISVSVFFSVNIVLQTTFWRNWNI